MQVAKPSASTGSFRSELREGIEKRPLVLTSAGLDLRFYRRSRTSASTHAEPAHVEFIVKCNWEGTHKEKSASSAWWEALPQTYSLKRRWGDIVAFHQAVCIELTWDKESQFTRIKTPIPKLPQKPDLDKLITGVASRGDSRIVHRDNGGKIDDLDMLHLVYVRGQLKPYFAEVTKILAELPVDLLLTSKAFEKFVKSGTECKVKDPTAMGPAKEKFFGPRPALLSEEELLLASKRQAAGCPPSPHVSPRQQKPRSKKKSPEPPPALKPVRPPEPKAPMGDEPDEGQDIAHSGSSPTMGLTMMQSQSSIGGIGAMIPFAEETRRWPKDEKRKHRMAASHYSFFAQVLKDPRDFNKASGKDFWKLMQAKERKELGRRGMWKNTASDQPEWASRSVGRLPALPPPGRSDPFAADPMRDAHLKSLAKSMSFKPSTSSPKMATIDTKVSVEVIIRDISEGLRVIILNDAPSNVPRQVRLSMEPEYRAPADEHDAIKIYRVYRAMLQWEEEGALAGEGSDRGDPDEDRFSDSGDGYSPASSRNVPITDLSPIDWSVLLAWAQHQEDFASDFKLRSCCSTLLRALMIFNDKFTSPMDKVEGVHLTQIIQWIWPDIPSAHVAQMLTWICLEELSYFRFPTPRLVDKDQDASLRNIFVSCDPDGTGYCYPEDVAGARDHGARLDNHLVDKLTVERVCGDGKISKGRFLEYMCEEGCRGHEDAENVWLEDGRRLVRQHRKIVDVTTWVLKDVPEQEMPQRLLADAIEKEIRRWRRRATRMGTLTVRRLDTGAGSLDPSAAPGAEEPLMTAVQSQVEEDLVPQ
mmetsp:Transcript_24080/g.71670  ORF Transcript_24080/g.71670 Transcript_24080/m.71670 type:complete len:813 (+) Transcript_24080:63-2501(+)